MESIEQFIFISTPCLCPSTTAPPRLIASSHRTFAPHRIASHLHGSASHRTASHRSSARIFSLHRNSHTQLATPVLAFSVQFSGKTMAVKEDNLPVFMDITMDGYLYERMVFELFYDVAPFTAENFRALCSGEKGVSPKTGKVLSYRKCFFHKVKKGSSYVKGGAFCYETGEGGESIYGSHYPVLESNELKHDREGLLSMARDQLNSSSHFIITLRADHSLDSSHVIFGKIVQGFGTLWGIEHYCSLTEMRIEIVGCGPLYLAKNTPFPVIVSECWPPEVKKKKSKEVKDKKKKMAVREKRTEKEEMQKEEKKMHISLS